MQHPDDDKPPGEKENKPPGQNKNKVKPSRMPWVDQVHCQMTAMNNRIMRLISDGQVAWTATRTMALQIEHMYTLLDEQNATIDHLHEGLEEVRKRLNELKALQSSPPKKVVAAKVVRSPPTFDTPGPPPICAARVRGAPALLPP